jgi:uncharacterized protein with HEPN domain
VNKNALADYIDHMRHAAEDACSFVTGISKDEFLNDRRTQNAVVMSLIVLGEASTKVMDLYPEFAARHALVPWRKMRGMRNRITHGYFETNFELVWDTVTTALPELMKQLPAVRQAAGGESRNGDEIKS